MTRRFAWGAIHFVHVAETCFSALDQAGILPLLSGPPEAVIPEAYQRLDLPPEGWTSGVVWIQAVADRFSSLPGWVEVDWARLYCEVNGVEQAVAGDDIIGGGLYARNP